MVDATRAALRNKFEENAQPGIARPLEAPQPRGIGSISPHFMPAVIAAAVLTLQVERTAGTLFLHWQNKLRMRKSAARVHVSCLLRGSCTVSRRGKHPGPDYAPPCVMPSVAYSSSEYGTYRKVDQVTFS